MGLHTQEEISAMAEDLLEAWGKIRELKDALRPFAKEADEYNGWAGLVMVEADEEGGMRESWYSISDLRRARDLVGNHPNQRT